MAKGRKISHAQDSSREHMPWINNGVGSAQYFQTEPVEIDASPETVWSVVKDIEHYEKYSKGMVTAHVNGEPAVNKPIGLDLYKGKALGWLIPHSDERISVVDDSTKIIGWQKTLPAGGGTTERYQVLEPTQDGKTMSYIGLRVPGAIGFFTKSLRSPIENAFKALNEGIKEEAEARNKIASL